MPALFSQFYEKSLQTFKKLITKFITFSILSVKRSKNKNLAAKVLRILKLLKTVLKIVTVYFSSKACFVYSAPTNNLEKQVKRI